MNFLIFDKDGDYPGRVTQSNKVFEHQNYHATLADHGYRDFVKIDYAGALDPSRYHIKRREPVERPVMPVRVSKTTVMAGGDDAAVFRGVPKNAVVEITLSDGTVIGRERVRADFDVPMPVSCTYKVRISLWPYRDFEVTLQGVT